MEWAKGRVMEEGMNKEEGMGRERGRSKRREFEASEPRSGWMDASAAITSAMQFAPLGTWKTLTWRSWDKIHRVRRIILEMEGEWEEKEPAMALVTMRESPIRLRVLSEWRIFDEPTMVARRAARASARLFEPPKAQSE